ncbi:MAG: hypothetical protein F6K28_28360 [Microcoleus sp. SIO2G3]|nr:hypothetical protein [Microcoleus sp. SIO2G3]
MTRSSFRFLAFSDPPNRKTGALPLLQTSHPSKGRCPLHSRKVLLVGVNVALRIGFPAASLVWLASVAIDWPRPPPQF